jgi:hypothetical protein
MDNALATLLLALGGLLVASTPSIALYIKLAARTKELEGKREDESMHFDSKVREFVLSRAVMIDALQEKLEDALRRVEAARVAEEGALQKLADASVDLQLANFKIESLLRRITQLEAIVREHGITVP